MTREAKLDLGGSDTVRTYESRVAEERLIVDATEAICESMEAQGVSRVELARRIGRTKGFVSHVLSGERNMTLRTLARMAIALNVGLTVTLVEPKQGDGPWRWRCRPEAHYFGGGPTCDCGAHPAVSEARSA